MDSFFFLVRLLHSAFVNLILVISQMGFEILDATAPLTLTVNHETYFDLWRSLNFFFTEELFAMKIFPLRFSRVATSNWEKGLFREKLKTHISRGFSPNLFLNVFSFFLSRRLAVLVWWVRAEEFVSVSRNVWRREFSGLSEDGSCASGWQKVGSGIFDFIWKCEC